jgi:hypothetical protein
MDKFGKVWFPFIRSYFDFFVENEVGKFASTLAASTVGASTLGLFWASADKSFGGLYPST